MKFGLWWDLDPGLTVQKVDTYAAKLSDMGIKAVSIVSHKARKRIERKPILRWQPGQWKAVSEALGRKSIEVGLSAWVWSDRVAIDHQTADLEALTNSCAPTAIEFNAEDDWKMPRGFTNLDAAANHLILGVRQFFNGQLEVSSYPYHAEMSATKSSISHLCATVIPEAYSRCVEGDAGYGWDGPLGPRQMQRMAIQRVRGIGSRIVCGLACYSQTYPGHNPEEAMLAAYEEVKKSGVDEVRYWSAKFCFGPKKNGYAADVIRKLAKF